MRPPTLHYTTNNVIMLQQIYRAIKAADVDGSGSIGVGELYSVITNLVNTKRAVKNLGKLVVALLLVIVIALASIFIVSMLAGEAIKESHVKGSLMTSKDGSAIQTDAASSSTTIFELPLEDTAGLGKINFLNFAVDMRSDATVAAWVELSMDVSVAYKSSYGKNPSHAHTHTVLHAAYDRLKFLSPLARHRFAFHGATSCRLSQMSRTWYRREARRSC